MRPSRTAAALLGMVLMATEAAPALPPERPNLLVLLMDDVGTEQLACYDDLSGYSDPQGYAYAWLPNIEALAERGLRLEQFRVMPVCSPTRASLLSGLYPSRHGVGRSIYAKNATADFREFATPPAPCPVLLPQLLSPAGYRTAAFGKWHLALEPFEGGSLNAHPTRVGFEEFRGPPRNLFDPGAPPTTDERSAGYHNYWWIEGSERRQVTGIHASTYTAERAIDWMQSVEEPWFAYVCFNACHAPLGGDNWPRDGHGFGDMPPDDWHATRFRATLEHMDGQIGRLVEAAGPNTIVFLLGDNGSNGFALRRAEGEPRYPLGHPLHREGDEERPLNSAPYDPSWTKSSVFDGGVRVPALVAGPGIAHGSSEALVDVVDLVPTLMALAGATPPPDLALDGLDVTPALRDASEDGPRQLSFVEYFFPNGPEGSIEREVHDRALVRRDGEHLWKLIHTSTREFGPLKEEYYFFHLAGPTWKGEGAPKAPADPLEDHDLGRTHPEFKETNRALKALVESFRRER